jgi:DNA-binding NtrC family response regulator
MNNLADRGQHVLAVDDEPGVRHLIQSTLDGAGYVCLTTGSAVEAHAALKQGFVNLVLLDIRMPVKSGMELLREIGSMYADVGIVMVTGVTDIKNAMGAIELGAIDYVTKPFQVAELLHRVARALEHQRLLLESRAQQRELERQVQERTAALEHRMQEMKALNQMYQRYLSTDLDREQRFVELSRSIVDIAGKLDGIIAETEQRGANDLPSQLAG